MQESFIRRLNSLNQKQKRLRKKQIILKITKKRIKTTKIALPNKVKSGLTMKKRIPVVGYIVMEKFKDDDHNPKRI